MDELTGGIFLAVIIVLLTFVVIRERKRAKALRAKMKADEWDPQKFDRDNSFNIAGINKRGLTTADCGTFRGFVECEPDNPYDPNAVAVLKGADKHVGYLNKEIAASLAEEISVRGGKLLALVQIVREYDADKNRHYFVGRAQILWADTE